MPGHENNFIADIAILARLTQRVNLTMSHNQIGRIDALADTVALRYLVLSDKQVNHTAALTHLARIVSLDTSWNRITNFCRERSWHPDRAAGNSEPIRRGVPQTYT